jgi:hypothetical protein
MMAAAQEKQNKPRPPPTLLSSLVSFDAAIESHVVLALS